MSIDSLQRNIVARECAHALMDLGFTMVKEQGFAPIQVRRFWQYLIEEASTLVNEEPTVQSPVESVVPMSDSEVERFGSKLMPFGKHKSKRVNDVPFEYLYYIVDRPDEFKEDLRRYLANSRIQNEYDRE